MDSPPPRPDPPSRRSSPRLARKAPPPSSSPDPTPAAVPPSFLSSPPTAAHAELAALLFPPSPPPPHQASISTLPPPVPSAREVVVISDSEDERQRDARERKETRRKNRQGSRGGKEKANASEAHEARDGPLGASRSGGRKGTGKEAIAEGADRRLPSPTPRQRPRQSLSSSVYNLSSSSSSSSSSASSSSSEEDYFDTKYALPTPRPLPPSRRNPPLPSAQGRVAKPASDFLKQKRRITISILESSSDEDGDGEKTGRRNAGDRDTKIGKPDPEDSDSDELPSPSRFGFSSTRAPLPPPLSAPRPYLSTSSSPPLTPVRANDVDDDDVEVEIAICTDDEAPEMENLGGDVKVTDEGVYIYDPTPKKRPVKLAVPSSRPVQTISTSTPLRELPPSVSRGGAGTKPKTGMKSKRGSEIDVTESSSDDDLPPPPTNSRPRPPSTTATPRPRTAPPPIQTTSTATPKPGRKKSTTSVPASSAATSSKPSLLTPSLRSSLPLSLIRELDRTVFRRQWDNLRIVDDGGGKGLPDGIEVVWNNRLRNTAGRASWKTIKHHSPSKGTLRISHEASIELATKVTDTAEKLKHTLAHELCHLAAWYIESEMKPPHGRGFKLWAARVMKVRPDIEVTTTHSYEIVYKYRWKCVSGVCGKIFGRHSRSIDPSKHGCPCGARIVAIDKDGNDKPTASGVTGGGGVCSGAPETPRKKSAWQEFMITESPRVRASQPTLPQSDVLKVVAERWKVAKAELAAAAIETRMNASGEMAEGLESRMRELGL